MSDNITARLEQLTTQYPNISFKPLMDQGDYIHLIVDTIVSSLLWGALFSVVVLFLFLRDWRPTLITLISIPTSVIFAVVLMYFTGVTINMISLSGLLVAVGMLVDNSVWSLRISTGSAPGAPRWCRPPCPAPSRCWALSPPVP